MNKSSSNKRIHSQGKVCPKTKGTNKLVERYKCTVKLTLLQRKDLELLVMDCLKRKKLSQNDVEKRLLLIEKLSIIRKTNDNISNAKNESYLGPFHLDGTDKLIEGMNFSMHEQALVCMERKEVLKLKEDQAKRRKLLYKRLNNSKLTIQTLIRYYKKKSDYLYGVQTTDDTFPLQTEKVQDKVTLLMEKLNFNKHDVDLIFKSCGSVKLLSESDRKRRLVLMKKLRNNNMNL
jgi:transposase